MKMITDSKIVTLMDELTELLVSASPHADDGYDDEEDLPVYEFRRSGTKIRIPTVIALCRCLLSEGFRDRALANYLWNQLQVVPAHFLNKTSLGAILYEGMKSCNYNVDSVRYFNIYK